MRWKIKILKTQNHYIMVGVAPIDFDVNLSYYNSYGWYFHIGTTNLHSGPPHNYSGRKSNLNKVNDDLLVVMDFDKQSLKFIINNEDKGYSYNNIPLDKPLAPVVFLYSKNDSVEIIEC